MIKMKEDWENITFNLSPYRDSGVNILSAVDDIQTTLDDQIVKTQTMRGSPFIKPFDKEIRVGLNHKHKSIFTEGFRYFKNTTYIVPCVWNLNSIASFIN